MNDTLIAFSEDVAAKVKAALASQQIEEFMKTVKASGDDRSFEVVMSTADEDRQGDSLDQSKWELKYYEMNPVVLWAHNYQGFPIGIVTDIKIEGNKAVATGKFAPEGINPEADIACALYQQKILRAVSPGYIQNDDGTRELLEVSFCPVPAGRYALSLRQVSQLGMSTRDLVTKGFFYETKGAVPYHDYGIADPDTPWDGPAEVKACGEDFDKLKSICAWFDSEDPDVKSSYKLPHHRASDRKAVWKGVAAAGAALQGSRGGVDIPEKDIAAVRAHLSKHYKQFGKTPPWEEKSQKTPQNGDTCEMSDGSPGILADDPENPGSLVCVPSKQSKSESMHDELKKNLKAEHERHGKAVAKAIDEFEDKALCEHEDEHDKEKMHEEHRKAIDEFEKAVSDEHEDHLDKCMKAIDDSYETMGREPNEEKAVDEFKAEMKAEHLKHIKAMDGHMDAMKKDWPDGDPSDPEVREEAKKAIDEFTTKSAEELDRHEKAHEEIAGEHTDDDSDHDEKAIADLIKKAGRVISAKNKEKLKEIAKAIEDHHTEHAKFTDEITAALKDLISSGDGGEEPSREPDGDEPEGKAGNALNSRSSTSGASAELETYLFTQRLVRQVKTASEGALRQINEKIRTARSSGR